MRHSGRPDAVTSGPMIHRRSFLLAGLAAVPLLSRANVREVSLSAGSSEIQAAIEALVTTGGTVMLPGRHRITAPVVVRSEHPISLIGPATGNLYGPTQAAPGLVIAANLDGPMVRYVAPKNRNVHGGGTLRGVNFYDETGSGAMPGKYTCTAALDLVDFGFSTVENCTFQWINGSAIRGDFVVMSSIRNNRVRYCGARRLSALQFIATDYPLVLQGTDFTGNKIEVCHGGSYLEIGPKATDCKFIANGFEADTDVASTNRPFLTLGGQGHQALANHFNRNTGVQVEIPGQLCAFTGNGFRNGNNYPTPALVVQGHRNAISANTFGSTRTGYEVELLGHSNAFTGNALYYSGALLVGGRGTTVSGNTFNALTASPEVLGRDNAWWMQDHPRAVGTVISNNVLSNLPANVRTTGGIVLRGSGTSCQGNTFHGFNGPGDGGVCIQVESRTATLGANSQTSCTTLVRRVASLP